MIAAISLVSLLAGCGGGGGGSSADSGSTGSSSVKTSPSVGAGPTVAIVASAAVKPASGQQLLAAAGSQITLDGTSSTDSGGSITAYAWTLPAKPAGSATTLSTGTGASVNLIPDVSGTYTVTLTITDSNGISAAQSMTIQVTSSIPVVNVVDSVNFTGPSTTKPTQNIALGSNVTLDASGSTDPASLPLSVTWTMLQQPTGSVASLAQGSNITHFSPDLVGTYQVRARALNANGAYSDVIEVFVVSQPPTIAVVANAVSVGGAGSMSTYTGYSVYLDSGASVFPAADSGTATWTMLNLPAASRTAQLSLVNGVNVAFVPDAPGVYVVQLSLLDSTTGIASTYTMTVNVLQAPIAVVTGSSSPVALTSAPAFVGQTGVAVTLRGGASYEPGGAALTYAWTLNTKPINSRLVLSNPTAPNLVFTPDVNGAYSFTLTVRDGNGGSSFQSVELDVGSYPPVALVAQSQIGVLLGATVSDSAARSYDQDGNALSYLWSIDAAPRGSAAQIARPNLATLAFTPDVAGTYTATVTVSDGNISSVASVTIVAYAAQPGTVPLTYQPLNAKFDKALGKAVIVSANPNVLHIVDPVAATDVSIPLPAAVKSVSLSPNGMYAGVLHEGTVSLVNLSTASLVHTSATGGSQTDVFVNNSAQFYLTGQTDGQWVTPGFTKLDGNTGATLQTANINEIYGTTLGIYSELKNKIFVISLGLSPSQIYAVNLDGSGNVTTITSSPYWGGYPMNAPFWLSDDQSLLYTGAGDYFSTTDLTYQGTFGLTVSPVLSVSNSATASETVLLQGGTNYIDPITYPSVYKRYTGSLQFMQADVALPKLGNVQTYGLKIFHASDDSHVMVVQTGSNSSTAAGMLYFLLKR